MTVLTQADWANGLLNPAQIRQFLVDWANGGAATHQVTGANDVGYSTYEQALADYLAHGGDATGLAAHETAAPAAQGIGQLDPAYEAYYQNALREMNTQRDAQLATNDYSRFLAEQKGQSQLGQLSQQWDNTRNHLPSSYIQRGVFGSGSGIYQQGLQNYARDRGTAQNAATDAYNQSLRSYDLAADKIRQDAQNRTLDLDAQRQARYQGNASALASAKPFTV